MKASTRGEDLFKSFKEFAKEKLDRWLILFRCVPIDTVRGGRICCASWWKWIKTSLKFLHFTSGGAWCSMVWPAAWWGDVAGHLGCQLYCCLSFKWQALLDEVGSNHPGLLLHSNARWLPRGKVPSHFAACLSEIRYFLKMKDIEHPESANTDVAPEVSISRGHDWTSEPAQCENARYRK